MKLAAIPLELRREEDDISVVDLQSRVSTSRPSASHTPVSVLDLIER
jgi:hypothetical protein